MQCNGCKRRKTYISETMVVLCFNNFCPPNPTCKQHNWPAFITGFSLALAGKQLLSAAAAEKTLI